jgi:hypothetical protein
MRVLSGVSQGAFVGSYIAFFFFRFLKNCTQYVFKILAFHTFGPPLSYSDMLTLGAK